MKTLVIILILLGGCIEKKDSSKEDLATLVALSQLSNSAKACITNYTCTTAPSFSTLAAAGTNTTCGASGCHDNTTQQSGLVITDYNSTKAFTNPEILALVECIQQYQLGQWQEIQMRQSIRQSTAGLPVDQIHKINLRNKTC